MCFCLYICEINVSVSFCLIIFSNKFNYVIPRLYLKKEVATKRNSLYSFVIEKSVYKMARNILEDFPAGPLDRYRKKATFDWKSMKILIETEDMILYNEELVNRLKPHIIFYPSISLNYEEESSVSNKRMGTLLGIQFDEDSRSDVRKSIAIVKNLFMWDPATAIKYSHNTSDGMTLGAIKNLGTERHQKYVEMCMKGQIIGCFCLTEIGHGSNTKAIRTTATYDPESQKFVLHTPDFEAAKCWAANLGQCASFALVYAQLYTPNGGYHGLHLFIVNIRDPETLIPYAGITVGNMGLKAGLNGIDNGFMIFNNYRIPRESLLNKVADVTPAGKYILTYEDPSQIFKMSMQAMSGARISIIHIAALNLAKAVTIGIRYSAVRKQFGPTNEEELPILEYQLTQWRLFPYLSASYVLTIFCNHFLNDFQIRLTNEDIIAELHAITSAGKAISGWLARDGIQECREVCGGHGYLKVSEIVDLRSNNDANLTYDGENNVLIQQTSNWLMKCWQAILKGKKAHNTALKSIYYLANAKEILEWKFFANDTREALNPLNLLRAYKWLVCYLTKESYEKVQLLLQNGSDPFTAKNNAQIYYLRTLSIVYFEHYIMEKVYEFLDKVSDSSLKRDLLILLSLYGAWSLDKHMTILYQGGYATGSNAAYLIKTGILNICEVMKPDAVGLVDAIAPHDFFMSSPLGASDGQMYRHLQNAFFAATGALSRPDWWQEISNSIAAAATTKSKL